MATRTAPITKQVAITGTETDLGALFGETEGKFRLTVPSGATSSVWLGKKSVTATGDDGGGTYVAGTCVQLPTTSLHGWFAITNGASVTITLECATGGADAPDWSDAGSIGASGGGGGGDATLAEQQVQTGYLTDIAANTDDIETIMIDGTQRTQITDGTNNATVTNAVPVGTEYGLIVRQSGAVAAAQSGTWNITDVSGTISLPTGAATSALQGAGLPAALVGGRLDTNIGAWLGSNAPTVGQKTAANSIPVVLPSDSFISPVTQVPSASGWTIPATAIPYVGALLHIRSGGSLYPLSGQTDGTLSIQGVNAVGNTNISRPIPAGFVNPSGANTVAVTDASSRVIVVGTSISGAQPVGFDPSHVGAFGDLISEKKTPLFGKNFGSNVFVSQLDATAIVTSGFVDVDANRLRLQTGTTSGASATYNSVRIATYREGMGMQFRFTAAFTTGVANSTQMVGAFTPDFANGYGFGYNGTSFAIFHRNAGSDVSSTPLAQGSWNGNVPSGFNPTFGNVYRIDYPFLGYGDVRFFIQDSASGQWYLVHTIRYANTTATIQLAEPALQFCARALSTSSTTNLTMYVGSYAAFLIGDLVFNGLEWSKTNVKLNVASATSTSVLAIRNCTTFNGKANKRKAHIRSIATTVDSGAGYCLVRAYVGATLGGTPAFTPLNGSTADNGVTLTTAQSVLSFDVAGTTVTGGTERWGDSRNRTSSSGPIDVTNQNLFIYPGETWVFEFLTSATMDCVISLNGQED